jgi:MoaA/NifB/PqqE/SkfB family radical SAM enzyme
MLTEKAIKNQIPIISNQPSPIVLRKLELNWVRLRVFYQLFSILFKKTGNPFTSIKFISQISKKYHSIFGEPYLTKISKVDNRYFWRLAAPGFPSKASFDMQTYEANRFFSNQSRFGLRSLIFAITKKCTLNCEHCFEWHNLNKPEVLDISQIIEIVHKYQNYGTTQIMLSGGEPMIRINDIYQLLEAAKPGTDFWIITSGIGLNEERARKLRKAGLTGVMVSLDHHNPTKHNQFRGSDKSYNWAIEAVMNANKAGLLTTLSLCATKSFVNEGNLIEYMELAKKLGVTFVQINEPRATGRYFDQDISLNLEQLQLLERIYLEYNSSKLFYDYPIIHYLGFHQRKVGCFGSGDRFFYIDTDGDAHICPYCSNKVANVKDCSAAKMVDTLANHPCHVFAKSNLG